jgi:pSer/pThr/pTyr-binding forkhead associated (FHA) protein
VVDLHEASLVVRGGPNTGAAVPLSGGGLVLGRGPDNDVDVDDETVSRRHAVILKSPDGYVLRDLDSANGTYVNRDEVGHRDHLLKHVDKVRLAGSEPSFTFRQKSGGTVKVRTGQPAGPAEPPQEPQEEPHGRSEAVLSDEEAALLKLLESNKGGAISRQEIGGQVWPDVSPDDLARQQVIDKTVLRLRAYLHDDPRRPRRLITVGDHGYVLV